MEDKIIREYRESGNICSIRVKGYKKCSAELIIFIIKTALLEHKNLNEKLSLKEEDIFVSRFIDYTGLISFGIQFFCPAGKQPEGYEIQDKRLKFFPSIQMPEKRKEKKENEKS